MSWWNIPDSEGDVTGDAPADAVDTALEGLSEARAASGKEKPSLPELLRALTEALSARQDLIEGVPANLRVTTREGVAPAEEAPADVVRAVEQALEGIAKAFRSDHQRLPRLPEVLYAFTFSLGGEPEGVLSGPLPEYISLKPG